MIKNEIGESQYPVHVQEISIVHQKMNNTKM